MKQTRAQRAASLRNLRKARRSRRAGGRRRRTNPRRRTTARRRTRRTRRRNPAPSSMPVVLVNPSRSRRRRRNPARRKRATRRRRRYTHVSAYRRRLPNPTTTWAGAFGTAGLGGLGGLVSGGLDWGASYLPIPAWGQAASIFGAGLLTSVGLSKLADMRVGAGVAGGTTAVLVGRLRQLVALARMGAPGGGATAAAVRRHTGAAAVVGRNAGQMQPSVSARTMAQARYAGARTFKQGGAGASYFLPGPGRRYGPHSWIYQTGAGTTYVSAHSPGAR